jgi:hypothetical protein
MMGSVPCTENICEKARLPKQTGLLKESRKNYR